jgi:hypothetical protein
VLLSVQTGSGAHPAFSTVGAWVSFPRVKRSGRENEHSPPSSVKVKNGERYNFIPVCLDGVVFK